MTTKTEILEIDLAEDAATTWRNERWTFATFQLIPLGATPNTASLDVLKSLDGQPNHAAEFGTALDATKSIDGPIDLDASSLAIIGPLDIRDAPSLHFQPNPTEADKRIRLLIHLTDRE